LTSPKLIPISKQKVSPKIRKLSTNKTNKQIPCSESASDLYPPSLVGKVSVNFCGERVSCGQCGGSLRPQSRVSRPDSTQISRKLTSIRVLMKYSTSGLSGSFAVLRNYSNSW
jgi:hypothetical protein